MFSKFSSRSFISDKYLAMSKKRKMSSNEKDEPEEEIEKEDEEEDEEEIEKEDEEEDEEEEPEPDDKVVSTSGKKKKPTPGVIYLSRIPNKMNVTLIRSYFDEYGQVGRIYLQLASNSLFLNTSQLI